MESKPLYEFIASLSHELRTPLNVVIGLSEMLLDEVPGKLNDEQRLCLDDILASSRQLQRIIDETFNLECYNNPLMQDDVRSILMRGDAGGQENSYS
jgi:signal transduction histidine kinase